VKGGPLHSDGEVVTRLGSRAFAGLLPGRSPRPGRLPLPGPDAVAPHSAPCTGRSEDVAGQARGVQPHR
jgi:hypothetical protein